MHPEFSLMNLGPLNWPTREDVLDTTWRDVVATCRSVVRGHGGVRSLADFSCLWPKEDTERMRLRRRLWRRCQRGCHCKRHRPRGLAVRC